MKLPPGMKAVLRQKDFTTSGKTSAMGRTTVMIHCPFCATDVIAYLWSLCGSGKKCACGAKFNGYGTATKVEFEHLT